MNVVLSPLLLLAALPFLHCLQAGGYRTLNAVRKIRLYEVLPLVFAAAAGFFLNGKAPLWGRICVGLGCAASWVGWLMHKRQARLKLTHRMIRILFVTSALTLAACVLLPVYLLPLSPVFSSGAGHLLVLPIEGCIYLQYRKRAIRRLAQIRPTVIAVTGSAGKTSVKNMIAHLLEGSFRTVASPASFNTPKGILRTVTECLKEDTEVLVLEYGARRRGDIAALCRIVPPDISVITCVLGQHLASFGSIEGVLRTKTEIVPHTRDICFYNANDRALASFFAGRTGVGVPNADVSIKSGHSTAEGQALRVQLNGKEYFALFPLLGAHQARNLALSVAVAVKMGVSDCDIIQRIATMPCVPHRLFAIKRGDMLILDDGYNSNAVGFTEAMRILHSFEGVRIAVTPGVVELGGRQREINRALGKSLCLADYAFVIGKNAAALREGALQAGMCEDRIFFAKSRDEAVRMLAKYHVGKTVVLFENDLPTV